MLALLAVSPLPGPLDRIWIWVAILSYRVPRNNLFFQKPKCSCSYPSHRFGHWGANIPYNNASTPAQIRIPMDRSRYGLYDARSWGTLLLTAEAQAFTTKEWTDA